MGLVAAVVRAKRLPLDQVAELLGVRTAAVEVQVRVVLSTCVQRRAGETEVLTIEIVILRREEPDAARVRPEARQRHLRKMLTIIVINIAL